jgi:hypothetical protein
VLVIVAYRQPIARSGVELIRGSASDSAIATLLERGLIAHNPHHLFVTTRAFLEFLGMRDSADLSSHDSGLCRTRVAPCEMVAGSAFMAPRRRHELGKFAPNTLQATARLERRLAGEEGFEPSIP